MSKCVLKNMMFIIHIILGSLPSGLTNGGSRRGFEWRGHGGRRGLGRGRSFSGGQRGN